MFVIDFDDTLFDTNRFKTILEEYFLKYTVSKDDFLASYRAADQLRVKGVFNYTFLSQLDCLRAKGYSFPDTINDDLKKILERKDLVFPDVEDFLSALIDTQHHRLLLTLGNNDFQKLKIYNTGLDVFFDEILVLNGFKENELLKRYQAGENKIFFINDNLHENLIVKQMIPSAVVVSKVNERKYSLEDYQESGLPYFFNLKDIKNYIFSQIK